MWRCISSNLGLRVDDDRDTIQCRPLCSPSKRIMRVCRSRKGRLDSTSRPAMGHFLVKPREAGLIAVKRQASLVVHATGAVTQQICGRTRLSLKALARHNVRPRMGGSARCRRGTRHSELTMLPGTPFLRCWRVPTATCSVL